jgi:hypothetical protein
MMIQTRHSFLVFLAVLLLAGSVLADMTVKSVLPIAAKKTPVSIETLKNAVFVGSAACLDCHPKEHEKWSGTWHANMLRKIRPEIVVADFNNFEITYKDVEVLDATKQKIKISPTIKLKKEGENFFITLVDKDNDANNQTYNLAYVLGGNWEQQFEARVGSMLYPTPMRWVVGDKQWRLKPFSEIWWVADGTPDGRPRTPEEMQPNQGSDAKCDGCHTTGLKTVKAKNTWTLPDRDAGLGISCEKCHGPGSMHVELNTRESIINPIRLNALQQDQVCGQCHSRVTNKTEPELAYPLDFLPGNTDLQQKVEFWTYATKPANFWPNEYANKNRQQYNDAQKANHFRAGVTCSSCHTSHAPARMESGLRIASDGTCKACHAAAFQMYEKSPMAKAGVACIDCHMAKIANRAGSTQKAKEHWDVSSHTFNVVMPYIAESYKMRSSCDACHAGEAGTKYGLMMVERQTEVQQKTEEISALIQKKQKNKNFLKAKDNLNTVLLDASMGAHNYMKSMELLFTSSKALSGK